jgi:hypothetical protein
LTSPFFHILQDAYDAGALEAITDVLQRHHGDAAVLAASTACLSSMATNPKYAAALIDSGALMGMLESVVKNPDQGQGVTESLQLLETIATNNPEALLSGGGADASTRLLQAAPTNAAIVVASVRTLEKLNKVPGGSAALIECDAIKTIISIVGGTVDAETFESSLRLLERTCRAPENAEYIRNECNGMQVLSSALENNTDSRVQKIGGRLLSKLASGSVGDLVSRMRTSPSAEKEFLASLLANLALEEENIAKIIQSDGISAIVEVFRTGSKKSVESVSKALARMSSNEEAVETIIASAVLPELVKTSNTYRNDAQMSSTVTKTIRAIINSPENLVQVSRSGCIEAVMQTFAAHPEFEHNTLEALMLIDDLAVFDFEMSKVLNFGVLPSVISSLKTHIKNSEILIFALRALIFFSYNEMTVKIMITSGAVEQCLNFLENDKKEVVVTAMYLATSLAITAEGKTKIGPKAIDRLLAAIALYATDPVVKSTAEELLAAIITEDQVSTVCADFGTSVDELLSSKNKTVAAKVKALATTLGAYCVSSDYAVTVVDADGLSFLTHCIENIATINSMPELEGILKACSTAVTAILGAAESNPEILAAIKSSGIIRAIITSIKLHPKLKTHVAAAVEFVDTAAQLTGFGEIIAEEGGVEACAAALRANSSNVALIISAFNTMLQISSSDDGAIAVAKHGGTRQVISCIASNAGTPGFNVPMEKALALLQRVSQTSEGADMLIKQGGLDTVVLATDYLSKAGVTDIDTSRVLARLLTKDDVENMINQLNDLAQSAKRGRIPGAEAFGPILAKLGHMSTVENFKDLIIRAKGAHSLADLARSVLEKPDDDSLKSEVLPGIFKAMANLSKSSKLDDDIGFASCISQAVEGGFALAECLECVTNIAMSSEAAANELCNDGKTLDMVVDTLRSNVRNREIATACFQALASLASHDSSAPIVAATDSMGLVTGWVDDNIDEAAPEAVEAALSVLANMARSPEHAGAMLSTSAIIELIKSVLTKACIEAQTPAPAVLGSAVSILLHLGYSDEAITYISQTGVLRRVVRAVTSDPEYLRDETCVIKILELFKAASGIPAVQQELQNIGAQELIVAGMNANGTSEAVIKRGADALKSLGAGEEAARMCLEEVKQLSNNLMTSPDITEDMVFSLGEAVQRLGNFMMIEGVVTAANAPQLMSAVSNAVALLAESGIAPDGQLAAGVQSIGRLVELGGKSVESSSKEAVEMVLDALSMASSSASVREAAVNTLGQLSLSPAGLKAISDLGAIEEISRIGKVYSGDSKLQSLVSNSLKKITTQTSKSAANLVSTSGTISSQTIMAVVQANSSDTANLGAMLTQVATVAGGDETIYDVICKPGTKAEVICEALRVLREKCDNQPLIMGSIRRINGLNRAVATTVSFQSSLTATSDQRSKLQALRCAENTLALLSKLTFDPPCSAAFFAGGSVDHLLTIMGANIDDEDIVGKVSKCIRNALQFVQKPAADKLVSTPDALTTIKGVLQIFSDSQEIAADAVESLGFIAQGAGADKADIDRECMNIVQEALQRFPVNARLKSGHAMLQKVMGGKFQASEAAIKAMAQTMQQAAASIAAGSAYTEMVDPSGRAYFVNTATGQTEWTAPKAYVDFKASMQAASDAARMQAENVGAPVMRADASSLSSFVSVLQTQVKNTSVAQSTAQTLATLSLNSSNAEEIARIGGVKTVIQAVQANPNDAVLVKNLLVILEQISRSVQYKNQVVDIGGADLILSTVFQFHLGNEDVINKALSTLANLAYNSDRNIKFLMARGVVKATLPVLKRYPRSARVLENSMCVLNNLMFGSDENKLIIGQSASYEVVQILRDHINDASLIKMTLRALGNLSFCDENIRIIVDTNHATKAIISAMRAHAKDDELQHVATEVIGNFASVEDDVAPSVDARGNVVDARDSIHMIILREAGTAHLINNLKTYSTNSAILKATLDALASIANDSDVTLLMSEKQNLIPTVIELMNANDWDVEIIERAITLLAVATYSKETQATIALNDGITTLLAAMEQHGSNASVLKSAQLALTNLAINEEAREQLRNMDGIGTILGLLEANVTNKEYVGEVLKTLIRLSVDEVLSSQIANDGMHIIMQICDRFGDPDFLSIAFRLLGHLAFVETNLTIIVQHNGIQKIIGAISSFPDNQPLMVRCIQTLDNISMANKENASIVIDEGGKELIEAIMETYPENDEIQKTGSSAILSLQALENMKNSADLASKNSKSQGFGKGFEPSKRDPLSEYRNVLKAGKVLRVWSKGAATAAHVLMAADFKSVTWQEIKPPQRKIGAVDLREIREIKDGMSIGHNKGLIATGKPCDPECAFSIVSQRLSLDLECNTPKEKELMISAFQALHKVFRENPTSLNRY